MAAPDRARQASLSLPLSGSSVQAAGTWSHNIPHTEQDAHLIHTPLQNPVSFYPHTLRPILKPGNTTLDSQFQLNASHVQKPLSLVPNENAVKNHPVSPARGNSALRDERMSSDTELSSSIDAYEPRGSVHHPLKRESPRECDRRPSPPTDSDDEDPFYFDSILSSPPAKKRDDSPRNTLSSSVLRRASIVPVDPTATPAPHRFSLLRERASEETIFVQEICDAEGRRWSLRVPASGLPEDMVHMLEELENLALELGQALPRIVVTCSAEFSLSLRQMESDTTPKSSELLHPPTTVNENLECDLSSGRPPAKEKCRLIKHEVCEEIAKPSATSSVTASSSSQQSLACIYLPELAPEFLSGSSTSPIMHPVDDSHSRPSPAMQSPRQRAFFSALREPARSTPSGIARRLATRPGTETTAAPPAPPPSSKSKSRIPMKSALPILKAKSSAVPGSRARTFSEPKSPSLRAPPSDRDRAPPLLKYDGRPTTTLSWSLPGSTRAHTSAHTSSTSAAVHRPPPAHSQPNEGGQHVDALYSIPPTLASASAPSSARKLKHFFRRPPVRSASDPPVYSTRQPGEGGAKRPESEVIPAPREMVERRMPRLPSARDLLKRLT